MYVKSCRRKDWTDLLNLFWCSGSPCLFCNFYVHCTYDESVCVCVCTLCSMFVEILCFGIILIKYWIFFVFWIKFSSLVELHTKFISICIFVCCYTICSCASRIGGWGVGEKSWTDTQKHLFIIWIIMFCLIGELGERVLGDAVEDIAHVDWW